MEDINQAVEKEIESNQSSEAEKAPEPAVPATEGGVEQAAKEAAAAWAPNFKIKSYDSEYEVPEMFRGLVKDAETEKQVREIFEKAYGLDTMKGKYQKAQDRLKTLETDHGSVSKEFTTYKKAISQLSEYVQNKDFDNYFAALQIPIAEVQQWMYNRLKMQELPPEQQQYYNQQVQLRQQNMAERAEREKLQARLDDIESKYQQETVNQRSSELKNVLSRPDIATIQKSFDEFRGEGSFIQEVINRASYRYEKEGVDLSADQAVQEVVSMLTFGQQKQAAKPANTVIVAKEKAPTLPNVEAKGTTPMAPTKVKSLDELKKLRAQSLQEAGREI